MIQRDIRVTISGPDDETSIAEMAALSKRFPFVEWGILFSVSRIGTPRYPSIEWINLALQNREAMRFSLHLCGQISRLVMSGDANLYYWTKRLAGGAYREFQRVQLNGWNPLGAYAYHWGVEQLRIALPRPIVQLRDAVHANDAIRDAMVLRADILLDGSGGRGRVPDGWQNLDDAIREAEKTGPCHEIVVGYAGGLGPHNVAETLMMLANRKPYWIDMETGIRSMHATGKDFLDMKKVEEVLTIVDDFRRNRKTDDQ